VLDREFRTSRRRSERSVFSFLRRIDFVLVASTFLLSAIGIVIVYSATRTAYADSYLKRQVVYVLIGVFAMTIAMVIDYRRLAEWVYPIYGAVVVALLVVLGVGTSLNGAQRWINIGPLQLQPSEFGVVAIILVLAHFVAVRRKNLGLKPLCILAVLCAVPTLLIMRQPDLGTTIVIGVVILTILVVAGVRARYLVGFVLLAALGFYLGVKLGFVSHNQILRLTSFLHQNLYATTTNYDLDNAKLAIGAGGFKGTGLFNGAVTSLQYVPFQYADFIFSAIGEQLGFVGAAVILGIYAIVGLRVFRAMQLAGDQFGRLICAGAFAFLMFSVFENVGMNIGIMPVTGIPLPFISYGGSAVVAFFVAIGLVANVEMHRRSIR
jgi:rod shape determining protein RodA